MNEEWGHPWAIHRLARRDVERSELTLCPLLPVRLRVSKSLSSLVTVLQPSSRRQESLDEFGGRDGLWLVFGAGQRCEMSGFSDHEVRVGDDGAVGELVVIGIDENDLKAKGRLDFDRCSIPDRQQPQLLFLSQNSSKTCPVSCVFLALTHPENPGDEDE